MRKIRRRRAEQSANCAKLRADLGQVVGFAAINAFKRCSLLFFKQKPPVKIREMLDYRQRAAPPRPPGARPAGFQSKKLLRVIPRVMWRLDQTVNPAIIHFPIILTLICICKPKYPDCVYADALYTFNHINTDKRHFRGHRRARTSLTPPRPPNNPPSMTSWRFLAINYIN